MDKSISIYKKDLDRLINEGDNLYYSLLYEEDKDEFDKHYNSLGGKEKKELKKNIVNFKLKYQEWYTEAYMLIKNLVDERLDDFVSLYKLSNGKKGNTNIYPIERYLHHIEYFGEVDVFSIPSEKPVVITFRQQLSILKAVEKRFESSLFRIKDLMQAQLFDNELDAATELNKKGFTRAAGALAGVVLEGHLKNICNTHSIKILKKTPGISDYNDLLYNNKIIEVNIFRKIQYLGDLRNLCDHKKDIEPTKENIKDLIEGTDKIIKTIS